MAGLRTIIVEDEPLSLLYLRSLLEGSPGIEVIGAAASEDEAVESIAGARPDLVLMDIELQSGTGFGAAARLDCPGLYIVFTTALDERSTNLLRLSGMPYIQKPIDLDNLSLTLQAAGDERFRTQHAEALAHLKNTLRNNCVPLSIALPGSSVAVYLDLEDICCFEATENGCRVWQRCGAALTAPLDLKELDGLLRDFGFFRPHMQYIVNRSRVLQAPTEERPVIIMQGEREVPVSSRKLAEFREYLSRRAEP